MTTPPAVTPRSAAAHAFVASVDDPELEAEDRHHLERVLRLRPGAAITVGDGRGRWRAAVLGAELTSLGPVVEDAAPSPRLTVAFALVKGDRPEAVVRALTEVGIDRIVPLHTARSIVRWDGDRASTAMDRLRRVARSAGAQCRRTWLPALEGPATFREVCTWPDTALAGLGADEPVTLRHRTVVVGPEGGWSDEEAGAALPTVGLGPHVLRTETAAMVAGVLLVAARGRG